MRDGSGRRRDASRPLRTGSHRQRLSDLHRRQRSGFAAPRLPRRSSSLRVTLSMTTSARLQSVLRTGLISGLMFGHAVLLSSSASASPPEDSEAGESESEAAPVEGPAPAPMPTTIEPEPAKVDKSSLPWSYRVGIVADTKERSRR